MRSVEGAEGATIAPVPFRAKNLAGMSLDGDDLRDLDDGCDLTGAKLIACTLGTLAGARLLGTRLVDCDLRAITLADAVIDGTRFVGCLFDERGLRRLTPRVAGPFAVVTPQLEWNPGLRGRVDRGVVEMAFWHGSVDRDDALELAWTNNLGNCAASVMHMSVAFGFHEGGPHGAGTGGAVRFDELLRDGPPASWQMPAELWPPLRDAIAARLPRWRPPGDPG